VRRKAHHDNHEQNAFSHILSDRLLLPNKTESFCAHA
jgi:hypothetical protein